MITKKIQRFFITAPQAMSLLDLLSEHLPSKYDAGTVIASGGVWLGRKQRLENPAHHLEKGETVRVYTNPIQGKNYHLNKEQIIFEDEDLLVVYKPANLNVHAVPASLYNNLAYGVSHYLEQQGRRDISTPATRLDRPVEGLVLFAKHKQSERLLFKSVRLGLIKKWYLGILEKNGRIQDKLQLRVRDKIINEGKKTEHSADGKIAGTFFAQVEELAIGYVYSIFPFTGKRHQIRFHAAHYLAPIIGDGLYGSCYRVAPDEIALMCRGYNIFWKGKKLKIRVSDAQVETFINKFSNLKPQSPAA